MPTETCQLELAGYVVPNPVRAHLVALAGDYPWSSYRAINREGHCPEWLERRATMSLFGPTKEQAFASYRTFVAAGGGARLRCSASEDAPRPSCNPGRYLGLGGLAHRSLGNLQIFVLL